MASAALNGPSRRISALLIAAGALCGILWLALPSRVSDPPSAAAVILVRADAAGASTAAVDALLALGENAFPDLLHASAYAALPDGRALGPEACEVVAQALERADPRALMAFLGRAAPKMEARRRATALRLMGERAEARDAVALLVVAEGVSGAADEASDVSQEPYPDLEAALTTLLVRDGRAVEELDGALARLGAGSFQAAARALGACRRARAMEQLADLLGRRPDDDSLLLAQLSRLGATAEPEPACAAAARVRDLLASSDSALARAAVNTLGRLEDPAAVPDLVELLASEDTGLARTAHAALKLLTGLKLRQAPEPWRAWHTQQMEWSEQELDATLEALDADEPAAVLEALRALETHPLERHLIAAELAYVLARPEPELRRAAAETMERLGSRAALDDLVEALEDADEGVAAAARRALSSLLGADHGESVQAWRNALAAIR